MIAELRKEFNAAFSPELYRTLIADLESRAGCHIEFRIAETPLFIPKAVAERAARLAEEIIVRSVSPELQALGKKAIPPEWNVADETAKPLFAAVDFAICGSKENPEFKLIELQGFPSLYHYQPVFSESVREVYGLPEELSGLFRPQYGIENYYETLKKAILSGADPNETVLLDIDPHHQKTKADFYLAEKHLGIQVVDIEAVVAQDDELFHPDHEGHLHLIKRIYNRAIVDELVRKDAELRFNIRKSYDVSWAGHPNWYFRISKVLLPHLAGLNDACGAAYYCSDDRVKHLDLSRYVLKPLYSFAGAGVNVNPAERDIEAIPRESHENWLLQEKAEYAEVITTPEGAGVRAELRVLLIWSEGAAKPEALHTLVRLTRGKMVGVDFNKGLDWVGSSCALVG